jgi:hypothetical protein
MNPNKQRKETIEKTTKTNASATQSRLVDAWRQLLERLKSD